MSGIRTCGGFGVTFEGIKKYLKNLTYVLIGYEVYLYQFNISDEIFRLEAFLLKNCLYCYRFEYIVVVGRDDDVSMKNG